MTRSRAASSLRLSAARPGFERPPVTELFAPLLQGLPKVERPAPSLVAYGSCENSRFKHGAHVRHLSGRTLPRRAWSGNGTSSSWETERGPIRRPHNRDVVGFFAFQVSRPRVIIAAYVMTGIWSVPGGHDSSNRWSDGAYANGLSSALP